MDAGHNLLAGFPVVIEQSVAWGEMDSYRHVNNVVYFRYFENARLEYLRRLDLLAFEKETGIGPILSATQARFRRPLTYPDTIAIGARLLTLEADRFVLEHKIVSGRKASWSPKGRGPSSPITTRTTKRCRCLRRSRQGSCNWKVNDWPGPRSPRLL